MENKFRSNRRFSIEVIQEALRRGHIDRYLADQLQRFEIGEIKELTETHITFLDDIEKEIRV